LPYLSGLANPKSRLRNESRKISEEFCGWNRNADRRTRNVHDAGRKRKNPLRQATDVWPRDKYLEELKGVADLPHWDDEEGAWEGGVGLHLEPAKNAFPKTEFTIRLRFKLQEADIDLEIPPKGHFQMKDDDRSTWQGAIEHTIDQVTRTLTLQPWEKGYEEEETEETLSEPIGFVRFEGE
jgi:hypothetical protein